MKEIEEDTINEKIFCVDGLEELNISKTQSNVYIHCNPYQNSNVIFHRNENILKFIWNDNPKQSWPSLAKITKLEPSYFLMSNCILKLLKQNGTVIKIDTMEQNKGPRNQPTYLGATDF